MRVGEVLFSFLLLNWISFLVGLCLLLLVGWGRILLVVVVGDGLVFLRVFGVVGRIFFRLVKGLIHFDLCGLVGSCFVVPRLMVVRYWLDLGMITFVLVALALVIFLLVSLASFSFLPLIFPYLFTFILNPILFSIKFLSLFILAASSIFGLSNLVLLMLH